MSDLDQKWSEKINEAIANAISSGRLDVAEYLSLKASNDAIRHAATGALFEAVIQRGSAIALERPALKIEREEPHAFSFQGSRLVGGKLLVSLGVRCLTVEAGWTRTPSDGFMRKGALAAARLSHYGIPRSTAEIILVKVDGSPAWFSLNGKTPGSQFSDEELDHHLRLVVGETA